MIRRPLTALAGLALFTGSATAGVVFSESFEAPVVSGFDDNTVPSGGKWIGASVGFGASNRGLYNETFSWPATAAFTTPYGAQAYYLNYSNSGLTTSVGATGQTLASGVTYKATFNAAVAAGTASGSYQVELVAFAPADDNAARGNCQGARPGTILATATGTVTTTNMSETGSLTFTPDGSNAHLGKDLGIRLIKATNNVLYDNIRLVTGHDMLPNPASGLDMPAGTTALSWTNLPPNAPAANTPVDVWFGTNPASLTQVVDGQVTTTTNVNAPVAGTYYWRVDSHPDGDPNGTPVTGDLFFFVVSDSDSDGLPDAYELAHTTPPSATALNPGDNLDSDGLTNAQEYYYGTDPNDPDTDNDTLLDGPELAGVGLRPATSPVDADSDDDGLSDGVESNTGTWVSAADTGTNPADADWDKDGLKDGAETNNGTYVDRFVTGTNPYLADTDNDGASDWYEATATFTNPNSNTQAPAVPYPLPDPDGSTGTATGPVKVYVMAGQSNTVGIGQVTGTALGTLETIVKRENKFPNLVDGSNNWLVRNDVIYKGVVSATAAGPLGPGQGASNTQLGPELGFGQIMGWYHDEPVLIIKASQGNRSLAWDFCPPANPRWTYTDKTYAAYGESPGSWLTAGGGPTLGGTWYAGKQYDDCFLAESEMGMSPWTTGTAYVLNGLARHGGTAYICKLAHTADASSEPGTGASWATYWNAYSITNAADILNFTTGTLQNLPTAGNNLNGRTFEIAGFCWWQGHKDQDGTNNPYATRYEANLVQLIAALREDFQAPNAPVVVASIGFGGEPLSGQQTDFQQVHGAQMAVGNPTLHPELAGTVKSVDILKYWRTIAESPTNQDYHYNKNAETYMLVGDAMGRAMLEMQDDTSPPAPSPLTFAIAPTAVDTTTVGMVATTAVDVSGPVEYYFENLTNSTNSGWTTSTRWDSTGLAPGNHDFRVKARDNKGNETTWSATLGAAPGNDVTKPSPDPMSFAGPLTVLGENSISMTATTATDINGVQYEFVCTAGGGPGSGWQSSPQFTATGLTPGTGYTYVVRAKDPAGNTTADSAPASATTLAPDTTAPTPATMSFATPPAAQGTDTITMTAVTASDPSGVEYYFEETSNNPGGDDSGWQNSASYTDTGLAPGTQYTYRVRARDKSPAQTANNWSPEASATTEVPDTTAPLISVLSPANGSSNAPVNSNLVVTFNEEIALGSGLITLKNLTDSTESTIAITDGTQVSANGSILTIDPTANLGYQKNYAIRIAPTAIEDLSGNAFAGIADDTTWAFTTAGAPTTPLAVIYEPFGQDAGSLGGKAGGTGLSGNWSNNNTVTVVTPPTLTYGSLPNSGGQVNLPNNAGADAWVSTGPGLGGAGLLNDGATLWFSMMFMKTAGGGSNEHGGFAFGTDRVDAAYNGARMDTGYGLGFYSRNNSVSVATWNNGASSNGSSLTFDYSTPVFIVGKIKWGDTAGDVETITLYKVDTLNLGTAPTGGVTKTIAGFNQAALNTVSMSQRNSTGTYTFDEIRFGATYEDVIGQGSSGPGPVASFEISPISSPQTVGTPITGITITAKDASNATATGFTGTVTFGGTGGFSGTSGTFTAGVLGGVSVTPTNAGDNLTLTVNDGASHTGSATIATIRTVYDAWSGGAPFEGDSNGDGVANAIAWALGAMGPGANAIGLLPIADNSDPAYFRYTFSRSDAANANASIAVQYGTTLGGWTDAVHDGDAVIINVTDGSPTDTVEVKLKRATLAADGRLFARLRVTSGP